MNLKRRDERLLFRHLDGSAGPAELAELRRRVREDARVREAADQAQTLVQALRQLPRAEPPRDLVSAARVSWQDAAPRPRRWRVGWRVLVPASALVTLAVLVSLLRIDAVDTGRSGWIAPVATSVAGQVWTIQDGLRRQTQIGDLLPDGALIETTDGASITFSMEQRVTVTLDEKSRVGLPQRAEPAAGVVLDYGVLLASTLEPLRNSVRVRLRGTLRWAELQQGSMGVLHDGVGSSVVACTQGNAVLHGADESVPIAAGYEVRAGPLATRAPSPILAELHLEMEPIAPFSADATAIEVAGRTNPGVQLTINGVSVPVDEQGRFQHRVSIVATERDLRVKARDAIRRVKEIGLALNRAPARGKEPAEPVKPLEMEWEWEKSGEEPG